MLPAKIGNYISQECELLQKNLELINMDIYTQERTKLLRTAIQLNPEIADNYFQLALILTQTAQDYIQHTLPTQLNFIVQISTLWMKNLIQRTLLLPWALEFQNKIIENLYILEQEAQLIVDNNFKSAIQHFYQAIACEHATLAFKNQLKSHHSECIAQYAHYLYRNHNFTLAQKYYTQVLKLDPDHITARNQRGMCSFKEEKYAEARDDFEQILNRSSSSQEKADAKLNIAYSYMAQKNWQKAANELREAKRLAPQDPLILEAEGKISNKILTQVIGQVLCDKPAHLTLDLAF